MRVTFNTASRCPVCGYRNKGFIQYTVRVNKTTLVSGRGGLGAVPRLCRECGHDIEGVGAEFTGLDPEDQAKVDAYRARRGWAA